MRAAALLLLCVAAGGCAYAYDRLLDLTDVIDVKYGARAEGHTPLGFGVKAKATEWLGFTLALGDEYRVVEYFGRRRDLWRAMPWTTLVQSGEVGWEKTWFLFLFREGYTQPQIASRFKVGGEIILPFVRGGLFVNFGEIADFLLGFTTLDIAEDDGVPKGAPANPHILDPKLEDGGEDEAQPGPPLH